MSYFNNNRISAMININILEMVNFFGVVSGWRGCGMFISSG